MKPMRKMTQEQLRYYVLAGYFPEPTDTVAICDLQDVIGHQYVSYIEKLLHDDDTHKNALKLLHLVWDEESVSRYVAKVEAYIEAEDELFKAIQILKKNSFLFKNPASDYYGKTISDFVKLD